MEYDARGNVTRLGRSARRRDALRICRRGKPDRQTAIAGCQARATNHTWTALGKIANYKPPEASSFFGFDQVQAEYMMPREISRDFSTGRVANGPTATMRRAIRRACYFALPR
ncbi:MAG: hypothetical protein R3F11_08750 [Verrucomicrobiales bacterium]